MVFSRSEINLQVEESSKIQEVAKKHKLDLENIKTELENFSFYSDSYKDLCYFSNVILLSQYSRKV